MVLDVKDIDEKFWKAVEREKQIANLQVVDHFSTKTGAWPLIVKIKQQAEPQAPEDNEE